MSITKLFPVRIKLVIATSFQFPVMRVLTFLHYYCHCFLIIFYESLKAVKPVLLSLWCVCVFYTMFFYCCYYRHHITITISGCANSGIERCVWRVWALDLTVEENWTSKTPKHTHTHVYRQGHTSHIKFTSGLNLTVIPSRSIRRILPVNESRLWCRWYKYKLIHV